MDWPEYTYWEAKLIYEKEVKMLKKDFAFRINIQKMFTQMYSKQI